MSGRGINASLAVQVEKLKKSMQSRDTRRTNDRMQRQAQAALDPYEARKAVDAAIGSSPMGDAATALAAVANAAALAGPEQHFCDLCQATFPSEAQYRQHTEGPTHRKALAKAKAQREREERLGAFASTAQEAVAAAAWAEGGRASQASSRQYAYPQAHSGSRGRSQQAAVPASRGGPPAAQGPQPHMTAPAPAAASHADLIASARKTTEPLTINGWIPPNLSSFPMLSRGPVSQPEPAEGADADLGNAHSSSSGDTEECKPSAAVKQEQLDDTVAARPDEFEEKPSTGQLALRRGNHIKLEDAELKPERSSEEVQCAASKQAEAEGTGLHALAAYGSDDDADSQGSQGGGNAGDVQLGFF